MKSIFSNSIRMTEKTLDFLWKRQEVTSNNIANDSTPGYKAKVLTFEDNLKRSLRTASRGPEGLGRTIDNLKMEIIDNNSGSTRLDQNNVSLDAEFVEQARTGLQYQYATRAVNDELMKLKSVIKG